LNQTLPSWEFVKTWLDVIQQDEIPAPINQKRIKMLLYFFGVIECAYMYVAPSQHNYKKVS
jgi:hypothetical protein